MSALQDALDMWDTLEFGKDAIPAQIIVKAAKRVANPDYKAALNVEPSYEYPDETSYIQAIVDAALGITDDQSDHLWVEDGERVVCTHCGITLKEGVGDACPDVD